MTLTGDERLRPTVAEPGGARLRFIDSLRGIAAMMVLCTHLLHSTVMDKPLHRILPAPLTSLLSLGSKGVQIFFVLSGFVIMLSLARLTFDRRVAATFALRRQIRLDPAYWVVLVATVVDLWMERRAGFVVSDPIPGVGNVLVNVGYLQALTDQNQIVKVAWTLAIEIQFYLFLLVLLAVANARFTRRSSERVPVAQLALLPRLLWLTGLSSLAWSVLGETHNVALWAGRWAGSVWFYFCLGALCALAHLRRLSWMQPTAFAGLMAVLALLSASSDRTGVLAGVVTAVLIGVCLHRPSAARSLGTPQVLQYLGARSYSIYLVHTLVISPIMRAGYKLTADDRVWALGWTVLGGAAALATAEGLYRWVERPSLAFSNQVKAVGVRRAFAGLWRRA
jgi:exopolysaccharide production protein ExoZ